MMHNVLVRHFDTPRLANCLRVTVDTGTQMDALLAVLAATLLAAETGVVEGKRYARNASLEAQFERRRRSATPLVHRPHARLRRVSSLSGLECLNASSFGANASAENPAPPFEQAIAPQRIDC